MCQIRDLTGAIAIIGVSETFLSMSATLKKDIALSDTGVVFNPATGDSFSVNAVGLELLRLLQSGIDEAALKAKMLERFEVEAHTLDKDYTEFMQLLKQHQLLQSAP